MPVGREKVAAGLTVPEAQAEGCGEALRALLGELGALPERRGVGEPLALGEALREGVQLAGGAHRPCTGHAQPPWHGVGVTASAGQ